MATEISEYIRKQLGRSSGGLVQSFKRFLEQNNISESECAIAYRAWIDTVKQSTGKRSSNRNIQPTYENLVNGDLDRLLRKLYHTVDAQERRITEQAELIAKLTAELNSAKSCKRSYQAPPQSVIKAMAVYGE